MAFLGHACNASLDRLSRRQSPHGGGTGLRPRRWPPTWAGIGFGGLDEAIDAFDQAVNSAEHRTFSHITQIWRARPLTDRVAVVEPIGATTTKAGLKVESALDLRLYEMGK